MTNASHRTLIVLAAGKGTRMKSPLAKVLHPFLGRPLLSHLLETLSPLKPDALLVVTGHQADSVEELLGPSGATPIRQEPQLGTGHALMCCREELEKFGDTEALLVAGDVPLLPVDELSAGWKAFSESAAPASVVTMEPEDPTGYGRILRNDAGSLARIVEHRDADDGQRAVLEVNSGVYFFRPKEILPLLDRIGQANDQGEFYLTDLFELLAKEGRPALCHRAAEPHRWLGVNSQAELARCADIARGEIVNRLMDEGVTVLDPATAWVDAAVRIRPGAVLHPFVRIEGTTALAAGVQVGSFTTVRNCSVGPGTVIKENCVLEDSEVGAGCILGPLCHTRPGTVLEDRVHLGNFVETKKSTLREGVKANHLSYLGDAYVGSGSNIGAGTITCNYDGVHKHPTTMGEGVFIGSDTQLVAPVKLGDGAYVGAGTTVTKDVPAGALAISRVPQKNVEGWAERKKKRKAKG